MAKKTKSIIAFVGYALVTVVLVISYSQYGMPFTYLVAGLLGMLLTLFN